eukprot:TRINITY_DN4728_c0_g1_i1.p1 TRINITY_DN4728_c0_g1~~TRINITY_DN4728_c0_g1_i1.p1  ORF type:complete len:107 (-),score=25.89 TRINITY_DN4728_c0_g1_i1:161-481(-)
MDEILEKNCVKDDSCKIETDKQRRTARVKVLFFARARDLAGVSEKFFEMEEGSTTLDCVKKIACELPDLNTLFDCMMVALNEEYVIEPHILKDGDELALIPPISGG